MPVTAETLAMVRLAAEICEDKKGTDTRILELDPADAGFTDFFLITSGSNTRQTGAIADEIELRMKRDFGTYAKSVEGRRSGEWILLDYIDFVVHIFTEQTREFYDIERLRKSARSRDTAELTAELKHRTEAARKKAPGKKAARSLVSPDPDPDSDTDSGLVPAAPRELGLTLAEGRPHEKKAARKAPAKKAPGKKAAAKKAAVKTTAKHTAPKKAPAKKAPAKKAPAKKLPAKKSAAKKTAAKKAAKQPAASSNVQDLSPRALSAGRPARRLPAPSSNE